MRRLPLPLAVVALLSLAVQARGEIVTVIYSAEAVTVSKTPFGQTVPLDTVVTGYFTFDTGTPDDNSDPLSGEYPHTQHAGFRADFLKSRIRGSTTPFYEVDLAPDPTNDTFRIYDGPRTVGNEGGVMSIDDVADSDIQLFVAITDDVFDDDDLIDPFPLYTFGFLGTPHTFSLKDDQGTMLLQFTKVAEAVCGDATGGGGITATDALVVLKTAVGSRECLPCLCDVDAGGTIASSDALKTLRFAVSGTGSLHCSACL